MQGIRPRASHERSVGRGPASAGSPAGRQGASARRPYRPPGFQCAGPQASKPRTTAAGGQRRRPRVPEDLGGRSHRHPATELCSNLGLLHQILNPIYPTQPTRPCAYDDTQSGKSQYVSNLVSWGTGSSLGLCSLTCKFKLMQNFGRHLQNCSGSS